MLDGAPKAIAAPVDEIDSWGYRETWRTWTAPEAEAGALTGQWLVVAGGAGLDTDTEADAVAAVPTGLLAALAAAGAQTSVVSPDMIGATDVKDLRGLISLASWDAEDEVAGVAATLDVLNAAIDAPLWCLTRHAVAVAEGDAPDPAQAAVWGLGRVAGLEHPDRWGGLVDVAADADEQDWNALGRVRYRQPRGPDRDPRWGRACAAPGAHRTDHPRCR